MNPFTILAPPLGQLLSILFDVWPNNYGFAIVLLLIFFITSSDSGSLVVDTITAGGKLHAPVAQRIFWASMEGLVAAILLYGGGGQVLGALQAGAITTALPFIFVLLLCCVSLWKGLSHELDSLRQRAPS